MAEYHQITFKPRWIGGNPIKDNAPTQPVNDPNDLPFLEFGVQVSSALRIIHTKMYNVQPNSTIFFGSSGSNKQVNAYFINENFKVVKKETISEYNYSWHLEPTDSTDPQLKKVPNGATKVVFQGRHLRPDAVADGQGNYADTDYLPDMDVEVSMFVMTGRETSFFPRKTINDYLDGYQHLTMKVALTDMQSNSYKENPALAIETRYRVDHGILCLPESYSPDGDPTRLIVFTHGHGVRYKSSSVRFNELDILPEYWLSEGYAIMDMDGMVTDSSDSISHDYEAGSVNSYDTAYQWVVRHFNIRTDGVFLSGRSMGGGMQFVLAKSSTMPILASAPIVPSVQPLGYLSGKTTENLRKKLLELYGVSPSETELIGWNGNEKIPFYELTEPKRNCLVSNQWRYGIYSPGYMFMHPLTDQNLIDFTTGYGYRIPHILDTYFNSVKDSVNIALFRNIPFRIYTCVGDPTVWYYAVVTQHKLLAYGGSNAQIHVFPSSGSANEDYSYYDDTNVFNESEQIDDHRFEIRSCNRKPSYVNSKGKVLYNVPIVYIETLAWWRRFENQDQRDN